MRWFSYSMKSATCASACGHSRGRWHSKLKSDELTAVTVMERDHRKTVRNEVGYLLQNLLAGQRALTPAVDDRQERVLLELRHVCHLRSDAAPPPPVPVQMTSPAAAANEQRRTLEIQPDDIREPHEEATRDHRNDRRRRRAGAQRSPSAPIKLSPRPQLPIRSRNV
jgi:hypothetical protein